jgi:imidazolonepropionase-like amidohydrolase
MKPTAGSGKPTRATRRLEIEALVGLGIPAEEVLAAATSRAAAFLDPSG